MESSRLPQYGDPLTFPARFKFMAVDITVSAWMPMSNVASASGSVPVMAGRIMYPLGIDAHLAGEPPCIGHLEGKPAISVLDFPLPLGKPLIS